MRNICCCLYKVCNIRHCVFFVFVLFRNTIIKWKVSHCVVVVFSHFILSFHRCWQFRIFVRQYIVNVQRGFWENMHKQNKLWDSYAPRVFSCSFLAHFIDLAWANECCATHYLILVIFCVCVFFFLNYFYSFCDIIKRGWRRQQQWSCMNFHLLILKLCLSSWIKCTLLTHSIAKCTLLESILSKLHIPLCRFIKLYTNTLIKWNAEL